MRKARIFSRRPPRRSRPRRRRRGNSIVGPFVGGTYLGVNLAEIDANRAKELKLKEDYGVEITRVEENSPAEKAGLKPGDVVLEYNGQRVEGMEQFGRMVRETPPGREVKLTISRNGATQTLTAVLGSRRSRFPVNFPPNFEMPEFHMPDIPQIYTATRSARLGVEAETLGIAVGGVFWREGRRAGARRAGEHSGPEGGHQSRRRDYQGGWNGGDRAQRIIERGKGRQRQENLRH